MTGHRVDSLDTAFAPGVGARAEGATPVRAAHETPSTSAEPVRAQRTGLGRAVRIVRDAAIAVALMAMVPIALVVSRGDDIWGAGTPGASMRARLAHAELMRPFALTPDPSITPMQAGLALASMQAPPTHTDFTLRTFASRPAVSWRDATLSPSMFATATPDFYRGPSSKRILEAVAAGFAPEETTFLRTLATAPVWREFDVVARASAVDIIGGRFVTPFEPGIAVETMPILDVKAKEMGYAAVGRAAYHMSIGQRDSAEAVLRSIVSFGFALMDNGTTFMDEVVGNATIGIGRDALHRFYTITGDPRAGSTALAALPGSGIVIARPRRNGVYPPSDEVRARLLARAADPTVPRAERYELLQRLSASSCTNVPELLFGRRSDVTDALASARRDLARYPSEQALMDLLGATPRPRINLGTHGPLDLFAVSASTIAGTVLRNPRMATCARLTTGYPSLF